jgi:nucleotide-binding universal stress UspA family protein
MFEKILVCLDGSDLAEEILPYAAEIARRFQSKLVLLEVTTAPSALVEPMTGYYTQTSSSKILRSEDEASTYLEGIADQLQERGLDVDFLTLPGSPGPAIVDYADENGFDLIALGTHGRSGLRRLVLGSVADYVLKESGLPVLARRPRQGA